VEAPPTHPRFGGPWEDFAWRDGERLVRFGRGALDRAVELLDAEGFTGFALLTTERASTAALEEAAEVSVRVPSGGVPDAAAAVREDVAGRPLVALGGGRVVDSAKAIAAAEGLRCAAIPTTLSGAELTPIHRLPTGVEGVAPVRPSLVIADPTVMASQAMPQLAASAMNALAHAVEALYVPGRSPVSDAAALRGAELIARALDAEDPERHGLALGAVLAGYAVGTTGFTLHHVLCQTLVALAGTPHAETNAVMLPYVIAYLCERATGTMRRLAGALGGVDDPGLAAVRVGDLAARAGPTRLSALGVRPATLAEVARTARGRRELGATPGGAPIEPELRELLERAL
jgi:alcohol dehydrogenase class IV